MFISSETAIHASWSSRRCPPLSSCLPRCLIYIDGPASPARFGDLLDVQLPRACLPLAVGHPSSLPSHLLLILMASPCRRSCCLALAIPPGRVKFEIWQCRAT